MLSPENSSLASFDNENLCFPCVNVTFTSKATSMGSSYNIYTLISLLIIRILCYEKYTVFE